MLEVWVENIYLFGPLCFLTDTPNSRRIVMVVITHLSRPSEGEFVSITELRALLRGVLMTDSGRTSSSRGCPQSRPRFSIWFPHSWSIGRHVEAS